MSRSYKKFPSVKDVKSGKEGKRLANRKVRNYSKRGIEIPNGKGYRKVFNTWDIYDYRFYCTKKDVRIRWEKEEYELNHGINTWRKRSHKTLDEEYLDWYKDYLMK